METDIKKICPICNGEIKENDNVKVCENCGASYHQSCWDENNGCSNLDCKQDNTDEESLEVENLCEECESTIEEEPNCTEECVPPEPSVKKQFCSNCGAIIGEGQKFCGNCGHPLETTSNNINNNAPNIKPTKKFNKKTSLIIGGVVGIIALFILIGLFSGSKNDFNKMFKDITNNNWCEIAKDGSYMEIDTNPYDIDDEFELDAYYEIEKINTKLGFTSSLFNKMGRTTSLDGVQTESNKDVTVSWKYHPDHGIEIMYEWND